MPVPSGRPRASLSSQSISKVRHSLSTKGRELSERLFTKAPLPYEEFNVAAPPTPVRNYRTRSTTRSTTTRRTTDAVQASKPHMFQWVSEKASELSTELHGAKESISRAAAKAAKVADQEADRMLDKIEQGLGGITSKVRGTAAAFLPSTFGGSSHMKTTQARGIDKSRRKSAVANSAAKRRKSTAANSAAKRRKSTAGAQKDLAVASTEEISLVPPIEASMEEAVGHVAAVVGDAMEAVQHGLVAMDVAVEEGLQDARKAMGAEMDALGEEVRSPDPCDPYLPPLPPPTLPRLYLRPYLRPSPTPFR